MPEQSDAHTTRLVQESLLISRLLRPVRNLDVQEGGIALQDLHRYAGSETSKWMQTLMHQTLQQPEEHDLDDDPFGNYLQRTLDQIKGRAESLARSYRVYDPAVVCCVTNFIREFTGNERTEEDKEQAVKKQEWKDWLLTLRETLVILRDLSRDSYLGQQLSILTVDVSAAINEALAMILLGPLVLVMVLMEFIVDYISKTLTNKVMALRCLPVLELWGILMASLHDPNTGILARMQGWVSNIVIRQFRKLRHTYRLEGTVDVMSDGITKIGWARMNYLIGLIDLLLGDMGSSNSSFDFCRLDRPTDQDSATGSRDTGRTDPNRARPDGGRGEGEGGGDTRGGRGPGGDGDSGSRDGTRGGRDPNGTGTSTGTGSGSGDDYVYLTQTNLAHFMTNQMGLSAQEAQELVQLENCRERVSPETQALLRAIGI